MSIWFSYSAYKQYKDCGLLYRWSRVDKKEPPEQDSRHNAIIGIVTQLVYADFYNLELWRRGAKTSEELYRLTEEYFWKTIDEEYIDWDSFSCRWDNPQQQLDELLEIIPKVLVGIKREVFLGPVAKAEQQYKVRFGPRHFLYGYLDFVIKKQDGEILLLDGKASRHREKNVDETQLYFYALMFYLRYRQLPDRMGFFYYRFADDPDKAMDWVPVDKQKIMALKDDISDALYAIEKRQFEAKPSSETCKWCVYQSICPDRLSQKASNREKRAASSTKSTVVYDNPGQSHGTIGFGNLKKK